MRHGSLFSGIGGFDLAAEWAGWTNVFHCEWNEFGQKALKYYWPDAESFGDITTSDFSKYEGSVDIISGGFPCQPYSMAGKRKGKEDDRHLWPEMLRVIKQVKPVWVVGENVYGLVNWSGGMVFNEIISDLENAGYEVQPYIIPAVGVDAPHRRDRLWVVAYSGLFGQAERQFYPMGFEKLCKEWNDTYSKSTRLEGKIRVKESIRFNHGNTKDITNSDGINEQYDRKDNRKFQFRIRGCNMYPDWSKFPTQPPICSRNDGIPSGLAGITISKHRNESIKAYGNAIVPQVAYQIFKSINEYEYRGA